MKLLTVHYCGWGEDWPLGCLADDGQSLLFEYSPEALSQGLELSPLHLKLRADAYGSFPAHLHRLPGLIADSLPDGWGLLLMDRLFRQQGVRHPGSLDRLLLRLDAPLGDEAARLVGELAAFLGLDERGLATRAQDAADILGLNQSQKAEGCTDVREKEEGAGEGAEPPSQLAELWPGRLSQALTAAALRDGLQGGLWLLDANLDIDFPWQANDAILVFRNGAVLNTFAKEGEVKLADCRLLDAVLDFQGACSITLERCNWHGNYDPEAQRTALNSQGQALTVSDCEFITRNARSIMVNGNGLTLTRSRFTHCGHEELNGGALWYSDHERVITDCRFDHCLAARGGAIWVNTLNGVSKCEFVACQSLALQDKQAEDVAVYANKAAAPTAISDCVFRQTSLVIGCALFGGGAKFVCSTQFQQGNVYYHTKSSMNLITNACSFEHGAQIERSI